MIKHIFTVSGLEELRSVSGFMARTVCLASPCLDHCLAESLWSEPTVLTISQAPPNPLTPPLLMERVELRW